MQALQHDALLYPNWLSSDQLRVPTLSFSLCNSSQQEENKRAWWSSWGLGANQQKKKQKRWTQLWVYKQRATKRLGDFESGDSIVKDVRGFKCRNKSNRSGNMMLLNWNTEACHLSCCLKTTLYCKPLKTVWHTTASFSSSNPCLSGLILGPAEFLQLSSLTPWPQVY